MPCEELSILGCNEEERAMPVVYNDEEVIRTMEAYGGSFVKALAAAWRCADAQNRRRLDEAFPDYWSNYAKMTEHLRAGLTPKS